MAQLSDLTDLIGVINAVQGKGQTTTTSGGTTTERTKTDVSDQGVNQILQQILSGKGGVRSVGNAARSSGMYDSTTEDMMLGDLYARAANQAELARSPTVRTTTVPKQTTMTAMPGMDATSMLGTLASTSALSSIMKGEMPFSGVMDTVKGWGSGGAGNAGAAGGSGGGGMFSGINDAVSGLFGGGSGTVASSSSLGLGTTGGISSNAIQAANSVANPAISGGFMSQLGGSAGGLGMSGGLSNSAIGAANAVAGGGASGAGSGIVGKMGGWGGVGAGAGGLFSGLMQEEEALDSGAKLASTIGGGFAAGGPVGAALATVGALAGSVLKGGSFEDTVSAIPLIGKPLGGIIGGIDDAASGLADAVGTVICTALAARGLIDKRQYRQALLHMHRVSPETLKGYHYWAVPVAQKIKNGHVGWTKFWLPFVESRISLLLSSQTLGDHIKNPLGTATKYLIEPGCYLLGKYLSWKEANSAQAQGV